MHILQQNNICLLPNRLDTSYNSEIFKIIFSKLNVKILLTINSCGNYFSKRNYFEVPEFINIEIQSPKL